MGRLRRRSCWKREEEESIKEVVVEEEKEQEEVLEEAKIKEVEFGEEEEMLEELEEMLEEKEAEEEQEERAWCWKSRRKGEVLEHLSTPVCVKRRRIAHGSSKHHLVGGQTKKKILLDIYLLLHLFCNFHGVEFLTQDVPSSPAISLSVDCATFDHSSWYGHCQGQGS